MSDEPHDTFRKFLSIAAMPLTCSQVGDITKYLHQLVNEGNPNICTLPLPRHLLRKFNTLYDKYKNFKFFEQLKENRHLARRLVHMVMACQENPTSECANEPERFVADLLCTKCLNTTLKDVEKKTRHFRVRTCGKETCAIVFESAKPGVHTWFADPFTPEMREGFKIMALHIVGPNNKIALDAERAFEAGKLTGYGLAS